MALLVFVALGISVSAQTESVKSSHSLSIGASIGLLSGEGEEIVYHYRTSNYKLSQLLWYFDPLVYAGVNLHYNWQPSKSNWGIFADGIFKYGFPDKTGQMEDRDWADASVDALTHYSVHDNETTEAYYLDANAGISFKIFEHYLLKTFVSYSFMHLSWTASRGSFLYPSGDRGHYYLIDPMDVGKYTQTWTVLSPGLSFYGAFNQYFDIDISLKLSSLIWLSTKDEHLLRDLVITGEIDGGFFVEPALLFSFKPNNSATLSFSFSYRNISGTRGDSVYKQGGHLLFAAKNLNGAGYSAFDVGIMVRFKLAELLKKH
jgi:outer membrane protease